MTDRRNILVTGASRGIGRAICDKCLGRGYRVVGIARQFAPEISSGPGFFPRSLDLADLDGLPAALQRIHREFPAIDTVICNAGSGRFGALEQFSAAQIKGLIDLNLTSQILLAREFIPAFKGRGHGDIIFMGSESALSGGGRGAVYAATKFGLRGLAQSLRAECAGAGVRVGIINPGMVLSAFFDQLDFRPAAEEDCHLEPKDVAEAVSLMLDARPGAAIDEINLSPQKRGIRWSKKT